MYNRPSSERGKTDFDWLESYHSFSFGDYIDRAHVGFGPLRVINEDFVAPGRGFDTHGHADMEIITYVLSGALAHKDSLGSGGVIRHGDVQVMSAGKGILHSEYNASDSEPVHLLQIWIHPREKGGKPAYGQKTFDAADYQNKLRLLVSPDGAEGSMQIAQDAKIWASRMDEGQAVALMQGVNKKYWIQVARGIVTAGGQTLNAGDGLGLDDIGGTLTIEAQDSAEVLVFELPAI